MTIQSIEKSNAWWKRAEGLIPAGTQTLSKGPTQFVEGVAPKYLARGQGSHVWDVDGNEYIDYPMALGAIILGHHYPATDDAIKAQLEDGITFSLLHPLEVEVSELLREIIPCAEMVRFGKNGSDVTTGAVRLARAYTGRDSIAHCGYHGWHDWYIASTSRNKGIPGVCVEQQFAFHYNNIASLQAIFAAHPDEIAAVIMEPYGATMPEDDFLGKVRDLAHENGAVLIFDEVATGFRFHLGGVHQRLGVDPDLACFGKAMGNGMPISALVGRAEIMQMLDEVFFSFTFGGECLSLAAAKATILELREKNVVGHLEVLGRRLQSNLNRLAFDLQIHKYIECIGLPSRPVLTFTDAGSTPALLLKSLFQQEVIKRGIIFNGVHALCYSHSVDDIEYTLGAYQVALEVVAAAIRDDNVAQKMEGRPLQVVFRTVS